MRADREHVDADRVLGDLRDRGPDVGAGVGLGEHDQGDGAAAPRHGEEPLDAADPRVLDQRVHDQHQVQVRGEHLGGRRPAGDRAGEHRAPRQHLGHPLAGDRHPVPDGGGGVVPQAVVGRQPQRTLGGGDGEQPAVHADDAAQPGAGRRRGCSRAPGGDLRVEDGHTVMLRGLSTPFRG